MITVWWSRGAIQKSGTADNDQPLLFLLLRDCVRKQLIQVYVQKWTRTTFTRKADADSGGELSHASALYYRFTAKSGHRQRENECPLWAKGGLLKVRATRKQILSAQVVT